VPTLDWIGKSAVVNHHRDVPTRLLHCDSELSFGDPEAGNLLVQGDNLEALKALLPYYAGKVKCIYIDPPYNTGNEGWVYNDNVNSPEIKAWLGSVVGREAEDLSRHDKWLCMMYPRLRILKEFLRQDGSIWISIDDNEAHSLKIVCDEVFGPRRFVANLTWQKRYSRDNNAAIGDVHEHILVYAYDVEKFKLSRNLVDPDDRIRRAYTNPNDDPKGPWQSISFTGAEYRANMMYPIEGPDGRIHYPPEGRHWAALEPDYWRLKSEGRIWFGRDGTGVPRVIRYLSEVEGLVPWSWLPHEEVGHTGEAKQEVNALNVGGISFATPKPERLLKRIIHIASNPGDIILDSFLGSGTTAAVAHKMGRHYVGVEMGDHAKTHCAPRLKQVSQGESGGISNSVNWTGGGGFRFCTLGKPLFDEWGGVNEGVTYGDLAAFVFFSDTGSPIPAKATGETSLLGEFQGRAVHLLFAPGSIGVADAAAGNVLTLGILEALPAHDGPRVVYGEGCTVPPDRLAADGVVFKQVPYQLQAS